MKKLLILFLAVGLFAACNNNGKNPFAKKTNEDKTEESSEDKDEKKKKGGLFGKVDENTAKDDTKSTWTKSYRDQLTAECEDEMKDDPKGRAICACAIDKLEKKYPDTKDVQESIETVGRAILEQCKTSVDGGDGPMEDRYKNKEIVVSREEDSQGKWTPLQRQQYIQGCETGLSNNNPQGYTAQKINAYCDCMTRKVEKKYNFQQAAKLTAADFQTQEWQSAAADCMPRY